MNIRQELENVLQGMKSALGVMIIDKDGLVVEKADSGRIRDLDALFIEVQQSFRNLSGTVADMGLGGLESVTVAGRDFKCLLLRLNSDYFMVLATEAGGLPGEGFYRLRRAAAILAPDFV